MKSYAQSYTRADLAVDVANPESVRRLYAKVGWIDAVVSTAGQYALRPLLDLTDDDFALDLTNKLMGQVNLVRLSVRFVANGGSFITSGIVSWQPMPGGAVISLVNAGLEGFVRAAALLKSRAAPV